MYVMEISDDDESIRTSKIGNVQVAKKAFRKCA